MEKYEYNTKTQQIKKMYSKKDFLTVSEIADNIDIRKVKDSSLINIIADAYEETKQFEKAKDVLLFAYERSPLGRQLAYRLTLICVNLGQLDEAVEFYDDFTKMAPKDMGQYLLQYEIAKAQGSSLDEQIEILEKYVSYELDEKWQYELAKLYHENGQSEQCIKQCDELILWFNEGKYVNQAMELKLLYVPLTKSQQDRYDKREEEVFEEIEEKTEEEVIEAEDMEREHFFNGVLLEEEYGGQLGLNIEPPQTFEEQISGQITIGEVLDAYEERKRFIEEELKKAETSMKEYIEAVEEDEPEDILTEKTETIDIETINIEYIEEEVEEKMKEEPEEEPLEEFTAVSEEGIYGVELESAITDDEEQEDISLDEEYKEIFKNYLSIDDAEKQIARSLNNLIDNYDKDGTSKRNNLIVIGDPKTGRTALAVDLIRTVNKKRERTGRKIVKVKGGQLNHKNMGETIEKLLGVDLIIEQAANMTPETIEGLTTALRGYTQDMIVVLEDNISAIERLLNTHTELKDMFENAINIQGLGVKEWAEIAEKYAEEKGYEIDEMGMLALHVKVGNLYSRSEQMKNEDVYEIIDKAINKSNSKLKFFRKKALKILKETDFM